VVVVPTCVCRCGGRGDPLLEPRSPLEAPPEANPGPAAHPASLIGPKRRSLTPPGDTFAHPGKPEAHQPNPVAPARRSHTGLGECVSLAQLGKWRFGPMGLAGSAAGPGVASGGACAAGVLSSVSVSLRCSWVENRQARCR
jgi:hypothetical protein